MQIDTDFLNKILPIDLTIYKRIIQHDQVGFTSEMQGWFNNRNVIHPLFYKTENFYKQFNTHRKSTWQNATPSHDLKTKTKTQHLSENQELKGKFLHSAEDLYQNKDKTRTEPYSTLRTCSLRPAHDKNTVMKVPVKARGQDREIKDIKIGQKRLFSDYTSIDFFGFSTCSSKPPEPISEFILRPRDKRTRWTTATHKPSAAPYNSVGTARSPPNWDVPHTTEGAHRPRYLDRLTRSHTIVHRPVRPNRCTDVTGPQVKQKGTRSLSAAEAAVTGKAPPPDQRLRRRLCAEGDTDTHTGASEHRKEANGTLVFTLKGKTYHHCLVFNIKLLYNI